MPAVDSASMQPVMKEVYSENPRGSGRPRKRSQIVRGLLRPVDQRANDDENVRDLWGRRHAG